jgi:hypothetical protein
VLRGWFGSAGGSSTAAEAEAAATQAQALNASQNATIQARQATAEATAAAANAPVQPYATVTIPYKALPGSEEEFARQLAGQEAGLNKLTAGEIRSNIEAFRANGRPSSAAQTIADFRRENPVSEDPFAQDYLADAGEGDTPRFAALHEPDLVIGGRDVIAGYGDLSVNASLGAQNRYNQEAIYRAVFNAPSDSFVQFIFSLGDQ